MRSLLFALMLAASLPPYAALPEFISDGNDQVETFGVEEFPMPNDALPKRVEGKHYLSQLHSEPPLELDAEGTWNRLRRTFDKRGWKLVNESGSKVLRMQNAEHDSWLKIDIFDSSDVRVSLIEVAHQPLKLTLTPPAAQPERITSSGDFPYLGHVPGSELKGSEIENQPLEVTTDKDQEPQLAGASTMLKVYTVPEGLSVHEFITAYRDALTAAGWNLVMTAEPSDGVLIAHYAKNGRDIWTSMHINGDDIGIRVADAGTTSDLRKQLDKQCHVPLYGIHFDFGQATLRADSEPALQQVVALLQADATLAIEVQGHTDNVGDDAANQKLSEARAAAVKSWLAAHGIAPARVTASGFGKTRPIVTNDTDANRARNRRVEIARAGCK